jgi:dihydrofolate reductase
MGKLFAHEFISLDGVVENPAWTFEFGFPDDLGAALGAVTGSATAILLGRTTYHEFEQGWAGRTVEDDPAAPFFNDTTKYVVSSTLAEPTWGPATVIGTYSPDAIREVKAAAEGDVYLSGSPTLARALVADGLIDELHLVLYPVVLGSGKRLFPDGIGKTTLALLSSTALSNGAVHLVYGPAAAS